MTALPKSPSSAVKPRRPAARTPSAPASATEKAADVSLPGASEPTTGTDALHRLADRADRLLDHLEPLLAQLGNWVPATSAPDWDADVA